MKKRIAISANWGKGWPYVVTVRSSGVSGAERPPLSLSLGKSLATKFISQYKTKLWPIALARNETRTESSLGAAETK